MPTDDHLKKDQHYLTGLDLADRRVVVVGGGTVAQRRLPRLVSAGALVDVVSPHVTPAVQALAGAGEITWHARAYADGDLDGAFSISEFCLAYKLSRSAVYKQISARRLRTMKVGSRTLISRRAARDWETLCEIRDGQQPVVG